MTKKYEKHTISATIDFPTDVYNKIKETASDYDMTVYEYIRRLVWVNVSDNEHDAVREMVDYKSQSKLPASKAMPRQKPRRYNCIYFNIYLTLGEYNALCDKAREMGASVSGLIKNGVFGDIGKLKTDRYDVSNIHPKKRRVGINMRYDLYERICDAADELNITKAQYIRERIFE